MSAISTNETKRNEAQRSVLRGRGEAEVFLVLVEVDEESARWGRGAKRSANRRWLDGDGDDVNGNNSLPPSPSSSFSLLLLLAIRLIALFADVDCAVTANSSNREQ